MIEIIEMQERHIPAVVAIENECFPIPWTERDFKKEILVNNFAYYFVAEVAGEAVGYAGMWHIITEGHITNVAVLPEYRGRGIGKALVERLIAFAQSKEMIGITLEVRISNLNAQRLYTQYGFRPEGFRKRYYSDTGEDAVIMWKYFETDSADGAPEAPME